MSRTRYQHTITAIPDVDPPSWAWSQLSPWEKRSWTAALYRFESWSGLRLWNNINGGYKLFVWINFWERPAYAPWIRLPPAEIATGLLNNPRWWEDRVKRNDWPT